MRPKKRLVGILCCGLSLLCACSYEPRGTKNIFSNSSTSSNFTLTVNIKGLVALTTTSTGQIMALLPKTIYWQNNLHNCSTILLANPGDPVHVAALRINPQYLSPDSVTVNNADFAVIPLRVLDTSMKDVHEDVVIQRKCDPATPVFPGTGSLAVINDFAPTLSKLCDNCTDPNPSKADHTRLVGRYTFDNGTISVGDEIVDTSHNPMEWYFDNPSKTKTLMQTVTSVETNCDPSTPVSLTLTDGTNPRSIPLYPKNGVLEVNIVNWMPIDVLAPDPMSQNSDNRIPNFVLFYLLSKDLSAGTSEGDCKFPIAKGTTVSGKPYCPLAVF